MLVDIKHIYFFIIIRSLRNSIKVVKQALRKEKKRKISHFFDLFVIRFIFGLTYFRNLISLNQPVVDIKNEISYKKESLIETFNDLNTNGCSKIFNLNDEFTNNLKKDFMRNCTSGNVIYSNARKTNLDKIGFENVDEAINYLIKNKIYILKSSVKLNNKSFIDKIINSPFFLSLAKSYLGSNDLSVNSSLFITNADALNHNTENENEQLLYSEAAQKYHFDIDYKKFFKILIYLSDVNSKEMGAHVYIPGTHRNKKKEHMITNRYEDLEIEKSYGKKEMFKGQAGSCFIVDTFGYHKGSVVTKGNRIAAFIEYGMGHFKLTDDTIFIKN